jgi:nucleoside phosphorylase
MAAEARALGPWARDARVVVAVSGGRPDRAEAAARGLVQQGVRALLSWGIAGALDPALAPGALILPDRVVCPDGSVRGLASLFAAAAPAAAASAAGQASRHGRRPPRKPAVPAGSDLLPPASGGGNGEGAPAPPTGTGSGPERPLAAASLVAGSDALVLDPAAKAALGRRTGAAAVDMESHRLATVAAEAGLPCFVVRAVSDPAGRALPALAATALDAAGRPRIGAVLAGLARRPGDLAALIRAARDSRAALATLRGAADPVLGAALGALLAR